MRRPAGWGSGRLPREVGVPRDGRPQTAAAWAIWGWGVAGVCAFLASPILRLGATAAEGLGAGLTSLQWAITVAWSGIMLYAEGYRGFHLRFSPRVVARASAISARERGLVAILAPAASMGLLYATRRRRISSWALLAGITALVLAVRELPHPWRAMVDVGVVIGLSVGLVSVVWHAARTLAGNPTEIDPDLPWSEAAHPPPAGD